MSRTYVLPVTNDLTGDPSDALPPDLVFREQARNANPPTLTRSASRQYYPFDYDPVTGIYGQANQEIINLGYVDPVELWERAGPTPNDRNAPDDFIATISVRAEFPAPDGEALCTLVDSNYSARLPSFILPESVAPVPPTPSRVSTRYGVPIFSGDVILLDWFNRPATTNAALVTINLTPCDGCELQAAVAAWQAAQKACCDAAAGCEDPPVITSVLPDFPVIYGFSFVQNVTVTITGSSFLNDDVITLIAPAGVTMGPPLISPTAIVIPVSVPAFTPGPDSIGFEVARAADLDCYDNGSFNMIQPS